MMAVQSVKRMLTERFKLKDLGKVNNFLGKDFKESEGKVTMSEERYVNKILSKFGMKDYKSRETPCKSKLEYSENAVKLEDPRMHREAVVSLIYLATYTRPDFLSFVVSKLSQHFAELSKAASLEHCQTLSNTCSDILRVQLTVGYVLRRMTTVI